MSNTLALRGGAWPGVFLHHTWSESWGLKHHKPQHWHRWAGLVCLARHLWAWSHTHTIKSRTVPRDYDRYSLGLDCTLMGQEALVVWKQIISSTSKTQSAVCTGRKAMTNLDSILKTRDTTLLTKGCIAKAMVFPAVIYSCESWTIKKAERQRIDTFKLWCWRGLLRVSWRARRSN